MLMSDTPRDREYQWHVRDLFGQVHSFGHDHVARCLLSRSGQVFLFLVLLVLMISDPLRIGALLVIGPAGTLGYVLLLPVYAICHWSILAAASRLRASGLLKHWPMLISTPLSAIAAATPVIFLSGELTWYDALASSAVYAVLMGVFETLFLRFVLPASPPDAAPAPAVPDSAEAPAVVETPAPKPQQRPAPEHEAAPSTLYIGGRKVPLDRIVSVEAREHHLHVTLDDDSFVQRARLRDVLAQAGAASGIQTHRSWWVAARAVAGIERSDGKPVLRLTDGRTAPIARSRLARVSERVASL